MATAYYSPGVYIEEVDKGPKPIQGVGTSVTAFVGFTERADQVTEDGYTTKSILSQAKLITNWSQFERHFGGLHEKAYLPYAVRGFFDNGGVTAWVISVHALNAHPSQALISTVGKDKKPGTPALVVHAKEGGKIGDDITVTIKKASASAPTISKTTDADSMRPKGGKKTDSVPGGDAGADTSSASSGSTTTAESTSPPSASTSSSSSPVTSAPVAGTTTDAADQFTIVVKNGKDEKSYTVGIEDLPLWSDRDRETSDMHKLDHVKIWKTTKKGTKLADRLPAFGEYKLAGGLPTFDGELLEEADRNLLNTTPADKIDEADMLDRNAIRLFEGNATKRKGLSALEAIDNVNLVCCPDVMMLHKEGLINDDALIGIQQSMLTFCKKTNYRFAILDAPYNKKNPEDVLDWRMNIASYDSMHAALYYPWIKISDPVTGRTKEVPPCGHIAGIYARSDSQRGVHKAPANEVVMGAIDLELNVTKGEQDLLNPVGINCIRKFPGRGVRVWGARTLSSDPAWRYINVRRLFNYVEESVERSTQWMVFEPNDQFLWSKARRDISAFLRTVWMSGALFGTGPDEAFYVKCDLETNPEDLRNIGIMVCEIGMAPVKPAEFVVFRFSQYSLAQA